MKCGLHALIDLSQGPVAPADAAALGLTMKGSGFPFRVSDNKQASETILQDAERTTILLGHADDVVRVSRELGVAADVGAVQLARLALDRWGGEAARRLPGEWMLLDMQPGCLTLMQSAARLAWMLYSRHGGQIAVSPDITSLARLSWIGGDLDEEGFMFAVGRGPLRRQGTGRTILRDARMLKPGECIRFMLEGTVSEVRLPFVPVPPWGGTITEAAAEAGTLLHEIVGERLARHGDVACLLSGGLDSSLLTMFVADRLRSGQGAVCLTSVAPPGSGLADELGEARLVADRLGLDLVPVVPGASPGIYAPDAGEFVDANGPSLSVRHYLYRALAEQARSCGVTGVFDGAFGEMTVTGPIPLVSRGWALRQFAKRLLRRGRQPQASAFHVRLAPHRLQNLPPAIAASDLDIPRVRRRDEAWGYFPGVEKIMEGPANISGILPSEFPFRDQRLLQRFAGFPARFLLHEGMNRAPARIMMAGRLPDSIRLRTGGMPFSPDYMLRLRTEAPAARARIPAFRTAGVADWLDLDWLDGSLARFARNGPSNVGDAFEVQLTAMVAEFLLWWRSTRD